MSILSQDDKGSVPIGMTAVHVQSPLLMHMQYQVRLPDHYWVVADRYKLISSVYACIEINLHQVDFKPGFDSICL